MEQTTNRREQLRQSMFGGGAAEVDSQLRRARLKEAMFGTSPVGPDSPFEAKKLVQAPVVGTLSLLSSMAEGAGIQDQAVFDRADAIDARQPFKNPEAAARDAERQPYRVERAGDRARVPSAGLSPDQISPNPSPVDSESVERFDAPQPVTEPRTLKIDPSRPFREQAPEKLRVTKQGPRTEQNAVLDAALGTSYMLEQMAAQIGYTPSTGLAPSIVEGALGSLPHFAGGLSVTALGTTIAGPGGGLAAGAAYFGATEGLSHTSEVYRKRISDGVPESQARVEAANSGAVYAAGSALLEYVGLSKITRGTKIGKALAHSAAKPTWTRRAFNAIQAGSAEGLTEVAQGALAESLIAYARDDWSDFQARFTKSNEPAQEFFAAMILGGGTRTVLDIASPNDFKSLDEWRAASPDQPQGPEYDGVDGDTRDDQSDRGLGDFEIQPAGNTENAGIEASEDQAPGEDVVGAAVPGEDAVGQGGEQAEQENQQDDPSGVAVDEGVSRVQGTVPISDEARRRFMRANQLHDLRSVEPQSKVERWAASFYAERGVPVHIVEGRGNARMRAPAMWTADGVVIARNAGPDEYVRALVYHEAFHDLKRRNPEAWASAYKTVREIDPDGLLAAENVYLGNAREAGIEVPASIQSEEALSQYAESVVGWLESARRDPARIRAMAERNPGAFAKILDAIQRVLNKLGLRQGQTIGELRGGQRDAARMAISLNEALDTLIGAAPIQRQAEPSQTLAPLQDAAIIAETEQMRRTQPVVQNERIIRPTVRNRLPGEFSNRSFRKLKEQTARDLGFDPAENEFWINEFGEQEEFSTQFSGPVPAEITEQIEGDAGLRMMFRGNSPGGSGEDIMSEIGADEMIRRAKSLSTQGETGINAFLEGFSDRDFPQLGMIRVVTDLREKNRAHWKVFGPDGKLVRTRYDGEKKAQAQLEEITRKRGAGGYVEHVSGPGDDVALDNPAAMPDGAVFEIAGESFVVYTDEDGKRAVSQDLAHDFLLEGVESIPVTKGSLRLDANEPVPEAEREPNERMTDDGIPFALRGNDDDKGVFGQRIFRANTGSQNPLFDNARDGESEVERELRERQERDDKRFGTDPDQQTLFALMGPKSNLYQSRLVGEGEEPVSMVLDGQRVAGFELDSSQMRVKPEAASRISQALADVRVTGKPKSIDLHMYQLIDWLELFEAYPLLRYIDTRVNVTNEPDGFGGGLSFLNRANGRQDLESFTVSLSTVGDVYAKQAGGDIYARADAHLKQTLVHELQHAIAVIEGWPYGSSPTRFSARDVIDRYRQETGKAFPDQEGVSRTRFGLYFENAGERMARNAERRRLLSIEERERLPYFATIESAGDSFQVGFAVPHRKGESPNVVLVYPHNDDVQLGEPSPASTQPRVERGGAAGSQSRIGSDDPLTGSQGTLFAIAPPENSRAFRRWFGDSKVVDENGKPLVMYHGTSTAGFTDFDTYASSYGLMGQGGYFTDNPAVASSYTAKGRGQNQGVYPVYLSIKNPIDMDAQAAPEQWRNAFADAEVFHEGGLTNESWYRAAEESIRDQQIPLYEGAEIMQDGLRSMGYDGITHIGGGRVADDGVRHRVFVAFEPEQIKSVNNAGAFDPENPDIRFAAGRDISLLKRLPDPPQKSRGLRKFFERNSTEGMFDGINPNPRVGFSLMLDHFRRTVQDKFLPVLRVQEAVEAAGGRVSEEANAYRAETIYYGKAAEAKRRYDEWIVKPLLEKMFTLGIERGELDLYLYAKHAPERNRVIAERNPDFDGPGSGMTDAEAAKIVREFEGGDRGAGFREMLGEVAKLREWSLKYMVENDLVSKAQADAWRATYQNYVPLRTADAGTNPIPRPGKGFDVRGPESKQAEGRRSLADSPLLFLIHQGDQAVVRAERNRVGLSFMNLVLDNPDSSLWSVHRPNRPVVKEPDIFGNSEVSIERVPGVGALRNHQNTIIVKTKGDERYIFVNNPDLVRSMKNLGTGHMPLAMRWLNKAMRVRAATLTTFSPEFIVSNFVRDAQTAGINIAADDTKRMAGRVLKNAGAAVRGSYQAVRGVRAGDENRGKKWAKLYREFVEDGGQTGWAGAYSFDDRVREIDQLIRASKGRSRGLAVAVRGTAGLVADLNTAVENGLRLSYYAELRESGVSRPKAAEAAKNLTVNFNRKGEWGTALNTLYLFFNASVQGNMRMLQAANTPTGRKIMAGIAMSAFALGYANSFLSDEDDDGELFYDKISPWERSHNLIVMLPGTGGRYIKLPLPYGYNVFHAAGTHLSSLTRGQATAGESVGHVTASVLNSFNPIGGSDLSLASIAPEFLKPAVEVETNSNFMDRPINPVRFPGQVQPDSQMFFGSTSPMAKWVAEAINSITGGDEVRPGVVDVGPGTIDHWFDFLGGSAGRFFKELVVDLPSKAMGEGDFTLRTTPFVRRFAGGPYEGRHRSRFWSNSDRMRALLSFERGYAESGDSQRLESYRKEQGVVLDAARRFELYRSVTDAIREEMAEGDEASESMLRDLYAEANRMINAADHGDLVESPLLENHPEYRRALRNQLMRERNLERDRRRQGG